MISRYSPLTRWTSSSLPEQTPPPRHPPAPLDRAARDGARPAPPPSLRAARRTAVCSRFVLYAEGEAPVTVEAGDRAPSSAGSRTWPSDGIGRAVVSLSCPIGVESPPRAETQNRSWRPTRAESRSCLACFLAWGAIALDGAGPGGRRPPARRGFVGLSLPAGALSSPRALERLGPVLDRLDRRGAPLFVHPGGAVRRSSRPVAARERPPSETPRRPLVACAHPLRVRDAERLARLPPRGAAAPTPACRSCSRCSPAARRFTASASRPRRPRRPHGRPADLLRLLFVRRAALDAMVRVRRRRADRLRLRPPRRRAARPATSARRPGTRSRSPTRRAP